MKKAILSIAVFLFSVLMYAQEYPFAYTESGEGNQTLLFIPGFASSGDVWNETIDALKDDYTCYTLTFAGFAGVAPQEKASFDYWKTDIARFIKDKKLKKPILIGHSMGGGLAMAVAADYPDLLRKIVIVDALPCLMALTNPNFQSVTNKDCSGLIDQLTAMPDDQFSQMQKMSVLSLTTNSSKIDEILNWGIASDRKTFAKIFCDFSNTDLRMRIQNINIPSLILLEPHFKYIASSINEQYKNLPKAQIKYASKGLHFIMFDDNEWFIDQLKSFLEE